MKNELVRYILRCTNLTFQGPSWPWSYGSWIYNYLCNQCLSPLMLRVRILIRARCTTLCDKGCQWLATGRGFSPGPPVSSTNKTDSHNVAEILLKVVLNTIKQPNERKWLIVHTFVFAKFCRSAFQQTVNIPYCALRPVNLFHFIFEADFIYGFLTKSEKKLAKAFHFTFHFIDYVLSLNNCNIGDNVDRIYPTKIDKKDTTDSVRPGSLRVPVNKESTETSG